MCHSVQRWWCQPISILKHAVLPGRSMRAVCVYVCVCMTERVYVRVSDRAVYVWVDGWDL